MLRPYPIIKGENMIRRFTPVLLLLSLLMLSLVLLTPFQAFALTTTPLPPTFTRTPTLTSTSTVCALPTAVSMTVSPVVSPTSDTTQTVKVNVFAASVTITSEAGSFTSNTSVGGVFSIPVTLVPNSTNHLQAVATITSACRPYNLSRSTDSAGNPLTIVQNGGPTLTPTITPTAGPMPDLSVVSITEYTYTFPTPMPDVNGCSWMPGPSSEKRTLVTVQNTGAANAGAFVVDMNGEQVLVSGLAAGQTVGVQVGHTYSRTRTATVDITGLVAESNETNNVFVQTLTAATNTPTGTARPTVCRSPTPSLTPTGPTPTITRTPTLTPSSTICSPVTSTITAPFSFDGAGSYCWQASTLGTYINSWNLSSLTVNNVNIANMYVTVASLPAKVGGYWYFSYFSNVAWGHFEAK